MQAIETRYHGHRFRSRLEARWAVFFDAFGLQWEYEPEGYDLGDAGFYLPDFRVDGKVIVEVKRPDYAPTEADWERWEMMLYVSGVDLFILADGVPEAYPGSYYRGIQKNCRVPERSDYALVRCKDCNQLGFERFNPSYHWRTNVMLCVGGPHTRWDYLAADSGEITAAKSARFEHGENRTQEKILPSIRFPVPARMRDHEDISILDIA